MAQEVAPHGTWSYRTRNAVRACFVLLAVTGATLGTRHLITKMRYSISNADHHSPDSLALQDGMQHGVSRASANITYRLPQIFQVGGQSAIWQVPASSNFFTNWAADMRFREGDVLRFSGGSKGENLDEVSEADYTTCTSEQFPIAYWNWNNFSDIYFQFASVGTFYFLSDNAASCEGGLKLAATASLMTIPPPPPRPSVNAISRPAKVFQVGGDSATWAIPSTTTFYEDWASSISFVVLDVLSFTFSDSSLQVDEVVYSAYEMCQGSPNSQWSATRSATFQFTAPGIYYFVANSAADCIQGMRFTANVYVNGTTISAPPPRSGAPAPTTSPIHFTCVLLCFMFWIWKWL